MDEKVKIEQKENPPPIWVKLLWGVFILWGLLYLSAYWFPDLARWMTTTEPDATQWRDYR